MKRIISTVALCMLISMAFAQKKAVKDAKRALGGDDYKVAKEAIKPALTDPETANDYETWKVLGDIDFKIYDKEKDTEKIHLTGYGSAPDLAKMYTALSQFYAPYLKADSLAELPDEKGNRKNKVNKEIVNRFKASYPDFYNGGAYYFGKGDYAKASEYFEKYAWEIPALPILSQVAINTNDSSYTITKYYAAISAMQAKNSPKATALLTKMTEEPYFDNTQVAEVTIYQRLAEQFELNGDSIGFKNALQKGASKFPNDNYFITNLINIYLNNDQFDEAIAYLDQAILNSPQHSCEFYSAKANIFVRKSNIEEAASNYSKALEKDQNCEKALDGLAVTYILKAQDLKNEASNAAKKDQSGIDAEALEYYKKALPLLLKYKELLDARKADVADIKPVLYKLSHVYYNLNMGPEYDAVEKAYKEISEQ